MSNLEIKNLNKTFGKTVAVKDFSFLLEDKQFLTILGPSGCGKSTLLSCIAGIQMPDNGELYLKNREIFNKERKINLPPEKRNIGFVFQNYALWPHMNVKDHLSFPLKIKKMATNSIEARCGAILSLLRLEGKENRYPHQLSGGEQQRVALGRALIMEPDLLLMDEPLSNLDTILREDMQFEIREIQKKLGLTAVLVTHDQREAYNMSDKVIVMNKGSIEQYDLMNNIIDFPKTKFVSSFIRK